MKDRGKYVGWGTGKNQEKPFSKEEFKKSYVKEGFKMSYSEYLSSFARDMKRKRKKAQKETGFKWL